AGVLDHNVGEPVAVDVAHAFHDPARHGRDRRPAGQRAVRHAGERDLASALVLDHDVGEAVAGHVADAAHGPAGGAADADPGRRAGAVLGGDHTRPARRILHDDVGEAVAVHVAVAADDPAAGQSAGAGRKARHGPVAHAGVDQLAGLVALEQHVVEPATVEV